MARSSYLARCVRGIEWIGAAEICSRPGIAIEKLGHREIHFSAPADAHLLDLGSADDIFLNVGLVAPIAHERAALAVLASGVQRLPWAARLPRLLASRGVRRFTSLQVIGSFLGRRNYNREEIEGAVGRSLAEHLRIPFVPHAEGEPGQAVLSVRVHIRSGEALILARVPAHPLHRRPYKIESRPGTLHPPLAYAMAMLADLRPGQRVLDPCCGVGTILAEAHRLEPASLLLGSDISGAALQAASKNLALAGADATLRVSDAGQLPLADGSVHRIISNVPWGGAVEPMGLLASGTKAFGREVFRVLAPGGRAVLLHPGDLWVSQLERVDLPIRLFGRPSMLTVVTPEKGAVFDTNSRFGLALSRAFDEYQQSQLSS